MLDCDDILRKLRILSAHITDAEKDSKARQLAELFQNLDSHITSGGYLPKQWEPEE